MPEYIEREAIVNNSMLHTWKKADLLKAIKDAPSVDVAPVRHGRWVANLPNPNYGRCSVCKEPGNVWQKYCPNCGAKMDLGGVPDGTMETE